MSIDNIIKNYEHIIDKVLDYNHSIIIIPKENAQIKEFLDLYEELLSYNLDTEILFDIFSGGLQIVVPSF